MMISMESTENRVAVEAAPQRRGVPRWRPARFASFIFEELGHRIIGGALAEGDVLPTEPALCQEFGFSRTVVREGLKLLEGARARPRGAGTGNDRPAAELMGPPRSRRPPHRTRVRRRHVAARRPDHGPARARARDGRRRCGPADRRRARRSSPTSSTRWRARTTTTSTSGRSTTPSTRVIMRASGNEIGLTIVRVIHRHGGATPPLAATPASKAALEADDRRAPRRSSRRSPQATGPRRRADLGAHRVAVGRAQGRVAKCPEQLDSG